jgi:hypothetical protein
MKHVSLKIRWIELFPKSASPTVRRARWIEWLSLGSDNAEYWSNPDELCHSCEHCDDDWCKRQALPCTINPILTFKYGDIGLACMGVGHRAKQLKLEI